MTIKATMTANGHWGVIGDWGMLQVGCPSFDARSRKARYRHNMVLPVLLTADATRRRG